MKTVSDGSGPVNQCEDIIAIGCSMCEGSVWPGKLMTRLLRAGGVSYRFGEGKEALDGVAD